MFFSASLKSFKAKANLPLFFILAISASTSGIVSINPSPVSLGFSGGGLVGFTTGGLGNLGFTTFGFGCVGLGLGFGLGFTTFGFGCVALGFGFGGTGCGGGGGDVGLTTGVGGGVGVGVGVGGGGVTFGFLFIKSVLGTRTVLLALAILTPSTIPAL